jgi:hypothetical protein
MYKVYFKETYQHNPDKINSFINVQRGPMLVASPDIIKFDIEKGMVKFIFKDRTVRWINTDVIYSIDLESDTNA